MPFIHVRSLPFEPELDVAPILAGLTRDLVDTSGVDSNHVTVTWDYFAPGHYSVGGDAPTVQPASTHPVIAELFVPDFYAVETLEAMLRCVGASIAARAPVDVGNVFVSYRAALSGQVYEDGDLVRW
ncbi:MAG: phenylpyruvate tautomerase PptA (4-oxalocrotonate tautomerase family) [Gammaproteobacteria bacterium]|jgi:phenylpyruvate tautomerase PptA (4-oxalocrotonate tautomerase family)